LFNNQIISGDYSKKAILGVILRLSLQKKCQGLGLAKGGYSDGISAN